MASCRFLLGCHLVSLTKCNPAVVLPDLSPCPCPCRVDICSVALAFRRRLHSLRVWISVCGSAFRYPRFSSLFLAYDAHHFCCFSYRSSSTYEHLFLFITLYQLSAVPSQISRDKTRKVVPSFEVLEIKALQPHIQQTLDIIRLRIETFLKNPELPDWVPPPTNPRVSEFLRNLRIPAYRNGFPSLITSILMMMMLLKRYLGGEITCTWSKYSTSSDF